MSVAITTILPAVPAIGNVRYVPLGGDGLTAPFAQYTIVEAEVVGDASSGSARITFEMDERYCSLISYMSCEVVQGTPADATYRFFVAATAAAQAGSVPTAIDTGTQSNIGALGSLTHLWVPPGQILPGGGGSRFAAEWVNVLADRYRLSAVVYLFDIRLFAPKGQIPASMNSPVE